MVAFNFDSFDRVEGALTNNCMQHGWGTKYYFPCTPKKIKTIPIEDYFQSLKIGATFAYNDNAPKLIIINFIKTKNNSSILVMCERDDIWCERDGFHPWLISEITFKDRFFIHTKLGSYFEREEADTVFYINKD